MIEIQTYQNAENGFCVLRVKARGHAIWLRIGAATIIDAMVGTSKEATASTSDPKKIIG